MSTPTDPAEPADGVRLPRTADAVCNMFAAARAAYGEDAPEYVRDAVVAQANRYVDDVIRLQVRASGTGIPIVTGPPAPAPADPFADPNARVSGYLIDLIDRQKVLPNKVSRRKVAKAVNIPHATVGRLPVWRDFSAWRKETNVGQVRACELSAALLAVLPDRTAADPAEVAAENEIKAMSKEEQAATLERLIAEQAREAAAEHARFRRP